MHGHIVAADLEIEVVQEAGDAPQVLVLALLRARRRITASVA